MLWFWGAYALNLGAYATESAPIENLRLRGYSVVSSDIFLKSSKCAVSLLTF